MPSEYEKRENGSTLIAVGWILLLFAMLVMFFHPAALKLGQIRFGVIAGVLAVCGVVLNVVGIRVRRQNR